MRTMSVLNPLVARLGKGSEFNIAMMMSMPIWRVLAGVA